MPDSLDTLQSLTSLTVHNATSALEQGLEAIKSGQTRFDLRNVKAVDSAAVSVMLTWQRAAQEAGGVLELKNLPTNLKNLTKLYGVCSLVSSTTSDENCGTAGDTAERSPSDLHHH
ncbi:MULTISPECIES: lipid asymmetry maintenance protein MlaB [unclassified Janthinobacterium]|uniref:STAS domain-containing protein n=1 Tax=unclassified Janthinobacterium TaxID=2610881 RepID=UPI00160C3050|nr:MULTISPECIES: STAS domain-containing protein [unclassified Janthinobacterium]MBB5371581.1 phospholipid transport system transporter-binding protein [Janthinobacterium sp. K2C7]MBB5384351.1 phospholipid transport system transporter-binding protein [Janthinobacterium sp. K2Li3]MBB5389627.1 phospholipid transport system transporter-binding protein [Janthinobacterium sp. K2E3]